MDETVSKQAVNQIIDRLFMDNQLQASPQVWQGLHEIKHLPSAQPEISKEYAKAVFTWLLDYQIKVAELQGRYTPYEVIGWAVNDWRKENE